MRIPLTNRQTVKKAGGCLLLFAVAFFTGGIIGKLTAPASFVSSEAVPASAEGNWGLSFQDDGQPPTANASFEELKQYDAYYAQDTDLSLIHI